MHTRVIDSAQPLFDIPTDEHRGDAVYDLEFDPDPTGDDDPAADIKPRSRETSGIEMQLQARGIELEDLSFLEPDLCTLDDWHAEVDAMVRPTTTGPSRDVDKELVAILTTMEPKGHFMTAAIHYMNDPKQWAVFVRDPVVKESCRCLGIDMATLQPRSLDYFRRDHAEVVPEMVANVRFQAHTLERQECIALILQAQPLVQAKQLRPSTVDTQTLGRKKRLIRPLPSQNEPRRLPKEDTGRMKMIREARQLENAERWKDTKESIRKAATRRTDALQKTELGFKQKEFEREVKSKSRDAKAEKEVRRKVILRHVIKEKTLVALKPQSDEEARLVKEMHKIELKEHRNRADRIKHAKEYQKAYLAERNCH
ncbi:Aste57867_22500 [Aphanomyces stellatus]|uniref:Aste57867_22500 protein n=1 Tax=Aphanomyces stellatus TaxID=120398 RepID=A0A485LKA0_9STRA|nr:hypothetical protein As57867_022430 [Aphanomyces stellatus]VFT99160.1 Aste57867_22500 [Aphanomyces stellatus]